MYKQDTGNVIDEFIILQFTTYNLLLFSPTIFCLQLSMKDKKTKFT